MGYQNAPAGGSLSPPCGLYQFMSHTEGTALAVLSPNGCFTLPLAAIPPSDLYRLNSRYHRN